MGADEAPIIMIKNNVRRYTLMGDFARRKTLRGLHSYNIGIP